MADEFATRRDLNGMGKSLNDFKNTQAASTADHEARLKHQEDWTKDQEAKLSELKDGQHQLELSIKDVPERVAKKMSTRMTVFGSIIATVLVLIQIVAILIK